MRSGLQRSGFTLLELLVSIVVIGVLITLLSSSLIKLYQRSLTAKCAGNLRQIGALNTMYISDHNNNLLPWAQSIGTGGRLWFHFLLPYLREGDWRISGTLWSSNADLKGQGVDIFKCPAQKDPFILNYRIRYGINPTHASYINGTDPTLTKARKVTTLKSLSKALFIADSMDDVSDGAPFNGTPHAARGYLILNNMVYPVSDRHQSGSNVLFVDGHVEFLRLDQIITRPTDTQATKDEKSARWDQRSN